MKKLILKTALIVPMIFYGQLNKDAKIVMQANPEIYQSIRILALTKYFNDNQLVSQEINDQCNAHLNLINNKDLNPNLLIKAISVNINEREKFNKLIKIGKLDEAFSMVIDWVSVNNIYYKLTLINKN